MILEKYEREIEQILNKLKSSNTPIVLFGASSAGLLALKLLEYLDLRPVCFGDNNKQKQGTIFYELSILSPDEIKSRYPDANIFICVASKDIYDILRIQLAQLGFMNIMTIDSLAHLFLKYKLYKELPADEAGEIMRLISMTFNQNGGRDMFVLNSLELCITEKCTLKCRFCANGMQYYQQPVHYDKEILVKSIEKVIQSVDAIELLRIMGGEPFLHPQFADILRELSIANNIMQIEIITNGTIIPNEEVFEALAQCKAIIYISNYKELSSKKIDIVRKCQEYGIYCISGKENDEWMNLGLMEKRGRKYDVNVDNFINCSANKNFNTLRNGYYYLCPRSAHGMNMGMIPEEDGDYINILDSSLSNQKLRNKLKQFIFNTDVLTACDYCNSFGKANTLSKVTPGVQDK